MAAAQQHDAMEQSLARMGCPKIDFLQLTSMMRGFTPSDQRTMRGVTYTGTMHLFGHERFVFIKFVPVYGDDDTTLENACKVPFLMNGLSPSFVNLLAWAKSDQADATAALQRVDDIRGLKDHVRIPDSIVLVQAGIHGPNMARALGFVFWVQHEVGIASALETAGGALPLSFGFTLMWAIVQLAGKGIMPADIRNPQNVMVTTSTEPMWFVGADSSRPKAPNVFRSQRGGAVADVLVPAGSAIAMLVDYDLWQNASGPIDIASAMQALEAYTYKSIEGGMFVTFPPGSTVASATDAIMEAWWSAAHHPGFDAWRSRRPQAPLEGSEEQQAALAAIEDTRRRGHDVAGAHVPPQKLHYRRPRAAPDTEDEKAKAKAAFEWMLNAERGKILTAISDAAEERWLAEIPRVERRVAEAQVAEQDRSLRAMDDLAALLERSFPPGWSSA